MFGVGIVLLIGLVSGWLADPNIRCGTADLLLIMDKLQCINGLNISPFVIGNWRQVAQHANDSH